MDTQSVIAVLGTAAGVVSAYYAYLQHQKSRNANTDAVIRDPANDPTKETKLWSTAVDKALENFRKARRDCQIEVVEQKNFDKPMDRLSTSELVLYVRYLDADNGGTATANATHRFELKINKVGDILEMESKGKRNNDKEKFH